jgi:predicted nucleic acid-binding protein
MYKVLIDTCFWISLYDPKDENSEKAEQIAEILSNRQHEIILPFPTLYEFVNSKLSRNKNSVR